jgi:hypothetical protein
MATFREVMEEAYDLGFISAGALAMDKRKPSNAAFRAARRLIHANEGKARLLWRAYRLGETREERLSG